MKSVKEGNEHQVQILMRQHEQCWQDIWELDQNYIKITTLYITLIGVYIGVLNFWSPKKGSMLTLLLIALFILLIGTCVMGVIYRTRNLLQQRLHVISEIDKRLFMIKEPEIKGIGKIRTSTYLGIIVVLLTLFAIVITLKNML